MTQAVDIGAAQPALSCPVHHLDPPRVLAAQCVGHFASAIRRRVVDHEHAKTGMAEDGGDEQRQVLALVVGRYDDESVHRCITRPTRLAAAATINVGSMTGVRNRSWGKNTID